MHTTEGRSSRLNRHPCPHSHPVGLLQDLQALPGWEQGIVHVHGFAEVLALPLCRPFTQAPNSKDAQGRVVGLAPPSDAAEPQ